MTALPQKDSRAVWAEMIPCCFGSGHSSARCGPSADEGYLGVSLIDGAAAQPAPCRRRSTFSRRGRDELDQVRPAWAQGKKPAAAGATQTGPDLQPSLQVLESSSRLVLEQPRLFMEQSSSFQPEAKQGMIDSKAEANAKQTKLQQATHKMEAFVKLQRDVETLQTKLQQATHAVETFVTLQRDVETLQTKLLQLTQDEAAARQRALRAELRELSREERDAREGTHKDMKDEWEAIVLAFRAPRENNTNEAETTVEPADALAARECVPCTSASGAELTVPESTGARSQDTYARQCLFIDVICHWVGTFVHRDWARVCSRTAAAVYYVLIERHHVWYTTLQLIGEFQSVGAEQPGDLHFFGPEPGPLAVARQAVQSLSKEVAATDTPKLHARDRFVIHLRIIANMYEGLRLHHWQAFATASAIANDIDDALLTLEETLDMRRARIAAAAGT
eukprot:TRINITY_DN17894_c0_g1_i3.p1 TRINITY_DN17894_c0_g1~~TRINITY_DN17894_c0_g1_i3.p1  ORF type:complete len:478 (+),score=116.04 TRINITY_DN17894_c0_g1_i3:85-1434(+)